MTTVLVALGGALGALARFLVDHTSRHRFDDERPLGVLAVNVTGSLLAGLALGGLLSGSLSDDSYRMLAVGLLGGFTTFSTVVVDTLLLAETEARSGWLYLTVSVGAGMAAAALGMLATGAF